MLRAALHSLYRAMEQRLVPGLQSSQHHYELVLKRMVRKGDRWLDIGCGRRMLPEWRHEAERELGARASLLVGIDLDFPSLLDNVTMSAKCVGGVPNLPFRDQSFTIVTANMVVEHIDDPLHVFSEVVRVLRPGGLFLFHTPNAAAYPTTVAMRVPEFAKQGLARLLDGRQGKDVFPTHYRANTPAEIETIAGRVGLEVVELLCVSTSAVFAVILPLALMELLWLRQLRSDARAGERSNLVVALRRP